MGTSQAAEFVDNAVSVCSLPGTNISDPYVDCLVQNQEISFHFPSMRSNAWNVV